MTCRHACQQEEVTARGDGEAAPEYCAVLGDERPQWWDKQLFLALLGE